MRAISGAFDAFRSGEGLKGQLLRGGVGSVAIKIGSTGLNVLLAIVLARALGAEGFGVYSFVFALITIMAIPAQMGLPNLVVRETAKAQAAGDWALMKGLWRWSTLMALMMSAALMAIGALAAWAFSSRLPQGGLTVFYWGLVLVPLVALGNLRGAALRGLRHVVQGQLPEFILRPAFLIALVLGAHFGLSAQALTASDAMMIHAVASLVAFIIGAWLLLRARPLELTRSNAYSRGHLWLSSTLPFAAIAGMNQLTKSTDLLLLGLLGESTEVGVYRIAALAAELVAFGFTAIGMIAHPFMARLHAENDMYQLQRFVSGCTVACVSLALPVLAVLVFAGRPILLILVGEDFSASYGPLLILAFAQFIRSAVGVVGPLVSMTGYERPAAGILACVLAANLALNGALIPMYGIIGAAWATAASLVLECGLLWLLAKRELSIDTTIIPIIARRKNAAR